MTIQETRDYAIFKRSPSNRDIDPGNLKRIKASISMKNLLAMRPILINKNYEIIDGQHRFQAAKELDLPIFYKIELEVEIQDIVTLNANQARWKAEDYVKYYASLGNEQYIKVQRILKKYQIQFRVLSSLLKRGNADHYTNIKYGTFSLPEHSELFIENRFNSYTSFCKIVMERYIGKTTFLNRSRCIEAFFSFTSREDVELEKFFSKLEFKINYLKNCADNREFRDIFCAIYNYKNPEPIPQK